MSRSIHCACSSGHIQGRIPGTRCTCCVTKDHWELSVCSRTQITFTCGQATTYTMTPPSRLLWCHEIVRWKVQWRSVVITDESRFCLYASDGRTVHVYSVDLVASSSRMHSPTTQRPHLRIQGVGDHLLQLVVTFGKVNSVRYIAQAVNPMLLSFLRQEGDVLYQDNPSPHIAAVN